MGRPKIHGMTKAPEYAALRNAVDRCHNSRHRAYRNYGARGITVCERWRGSFAAFFADMGPRPSPRHSLDRIDNDGNYEPGNCRWATRSEQGNNRAVCRRLVINGRDMTVTEWAAESGVDRSTIYQRLKNGWDAHRAVHEKPAVLMLSHGGETRTAAQWAKRLDLGLGAIHGRLAIGWSVERALTTPRVRRRRAA